MSRKNFLAKILFLFFTVINLGLATVSCSDDKEDDAKTTTNTTQEEDDEDLDSIPIEEMTLEQRRKVFIGSWEFVFDNIFLDNYKDTITFYKNGYVKQVNGYFNSSTFELSDSNNRHWIKFNTDNTDVVIKSFSYILERDENNIYTVTLKNFMVVTYDDAVHNTIYRKIK